MKGIKRSCMDSDRVTERLREVELVMRKSLKMCKVERGPKDRKSNCKGNSRK